MRETSLTLLDQSAVTDRADRMTVDDGINRRDFWGSVKVLLDRTMPSTELTFVGPTVLGSSRPAPLGNGGKICL
jgi:hypothetical protein